MSAGMTNEQAWLARPEAKWERARDCVQGVVSRLRAILDRDAPAVCESLVPDEIEMLMLQLKLGAGHLGSAAVALREVEEERKALAAWRAQEELRFERDDLNDRSDVNDEQLRTEN